MSSKANEARYFGIHDIMNLTELLDHCFSKFPGIPANNFGGPRFPGSPKLEFPVALVRSDGFPVGKSSESVKCAVTDPCLRMRHRPSS